MSSQQEEPASSSENDTPSSSCVPLKTESSHDSKDLTDCAVEKNSILVDETKHANVVELAENIQNIKNIDEDTEIGTENVDKNDKIIFQDKETVPMNIGETNDSVCDSETNVSENKISDDDEEELKLRWDDDDEEDQEKALDEQKTMKDESSDITVADKLSASVIPTVEEVQNTMLETSKETKDINIDKQIKDHEMIKIITSKDKDNVFLKQKSIPSHIEASFKDKTITEQPNCIDSEKVIEPDNHVKETETKATQEIKNNKSLSDTSDCKENNLENVTELENTKTKNKVSLSDSAKSAIELEKSDQKVNVAMEIDNQDLLNKSDILPSTGSDSCLDDSFKTIEHGLTKPDMMLEIPTQELVEFSDEDSESLHRIDASDKTHSGNSFEGKANSSNAHFEKSVPNITTSGIIDVDMESSSVSSEIMLKYDDTDQSFDETEETSKVNVLNTDTSGVVDVDTKSTSDDNNSEIVLKYDDTDQLLDENDDEHMDVDVDTPKKSVQDIESDESKATLPNYVVDTILKDTITKLDKDIKNLTDEIEEPDDFDQPSLDKNLPTDDLVDKTLVDTIVAKLDEDIKNLTDEIEISDDLDLPLEESSKEKDLNIELTQPSILLATEIENRDKVLKDTITRLDEDIKNLTDEIETSDHLGINLNQPSKAENLNLELAPLSVSSTKKVESVNDKILKETITKLDEDIKNLTDEIEMSDDFDQSSKTKDSQIAQPLILAQADSKLDVIDDKTLKDTITKLDVTIENLTDEICDNADTNLDQASKTENLVQPPTLAKETNLPNTSRSEDATVTDAITKLDDDIKNEDETNESQNLKLKLDLTSKPEDSNLEIAQASTSFAKDSLPETSCDDKMEVQPSTSAAADQLAPDTTDELPEVTDSLGLLAESSRVVEDDEEADEDDDGDDDDDFDQDDESSNQMTAEHSEDSNAQHSEPDTKDQDTPTTAKEAPDFSVGTVAIDKVQSKEVDVKSVDKPGEDGEVTTVPKDESPKHKQNKVSIADIETVKLSDTSDNETEVDTTLSARLLKKALLGADAKKTLKLNIENETTSSSKMETFALEENSEILSIVDLDESSSEGDIQEIDKPSEADKDHVTAGGSKPDGTKSQVQPQIKELQADGALGTLKCGHQNKYKLNFVKNKVEVPIISTNFIEATPENADSNKKSTFDLEVFNLDSDEDDTPAVSKRPSSSPKSLTALEMDKARESNRCINYSCDSGSGATYMTADPATVAYYDAGRKRNAVVCIKCENVVRERTQSLVKGIKELTPLLNLDMKVSSDLVEISDSESEEEGDGDNENKERIGEIGAKFLEEQLADMINETWRKYRLDSRLTDAQEELNKDMQMLEEESVKIDTLLNECQVATDKLRNDLYATFEPGRRELPAVGLVESNGCMYVIPERCEPTNEIETRAKRRMSSAAPPPPAKRPAIPLGYMPLAQDTQDSKSIDVNKLDDDKDISVVKLSMESAPPDLPPTGEVTRAPLRVGMSLYAMRNTFCSWLKVKITEVHSKANNPSAAFTMCRVKFERVKVNSRVLPARCLAYAEPADVRLTIGTRVIALFKESTTDGSQPKESFYSGIVAEIPNPVNKFRYLIFFDDGYAQYVKHCDTRVVCESASLVWEEVHPFSREFVRNYLLTYPERPMVRLHAGQSLKTEWNGKWWVSRVIQVDASLVQVHFEEDNRTEWIYRGSTRLAPLFLELQAAERQRARPMPRSNQRRMNMPYVEYTRSDEQGKENTPQTAQAQQQQNEDIRRQRAVAKKSTVPPMNQPPPPPSAQTNVSNLDSVTSRVVYYTPKNAVKPYKMVTHVCTPKCKRSDVLALKDLRTYNPLAKPLLSGWERQVVRFKGHKEVMYRAPCGRRLRNMKELHRYLQTIQSDMAVDLFDFHPNTHCLAEFVLNKCLVGKKDLSHGKENVPVPCVNYYDDSLPEFCSYNTERTPTAGVPLNIDPDFLCGCDCQDDCEDKSKCACWKMTLEGARTIGLEDSNVGYEYKRLPEPLPSGIYECNSRCKCRQTCLNRVAQHPLQLKLQVFKTYNRGWGIRALNDVPKGSFLCVYAGNLLTDATANLDGLNEGDEYLAELDYIEVVEQMKEGYEEDIPEADKKLDKAGKNKSSDEDETSTEEEEDNTKDDDKADDDFRPGFIGLGLTDFDKRLRKREKKERKNKAANDKEQTKDNEEKKESVDDNGCITISDDEEVREPSRFMAQTEMGANFISKHKSVRSYFGKDEACYIMDAKVQGNIGRYLNHSCTPNVFVQNVFVDTHDPRFPWVAFFALSHIRAGTELTWNYNYDIGSVPGKVLYCYCGAPNCRGRLL